MRFETAPAPHVVAGFTVPRVMFPVLLALMLARGAFRQAAAIEATLG